MSPATTTSSTKHSVSFVEGEIYEPAELDERHCPTSTAASVVSTTVGGTAPSDGRVQSVAYGKLALSTLPQSVATAKTVTCCLSASSDFKKFGDDESFGVAELANYYRPRTGNMSNSAAKPAKKSSIDRSPSQGDPTDFGGSKSRKPTGLPEPTATQSGQGRKPSWSELDAKLRVDAAARQAHFELLKKGRRRTDRAPE